MRKSLLALFVFTSLSLIGGGVNAEELLQPKPGIITKRMLTVFGPAWTYTCTQVLSGEATLSDCEAPSTLIATAYENAVKPTKHREVVYLTISSIECRAAADVCAAARKRLPAGWVKSVK